MKKYVKKHRINKLMKVLIKELHYVPNTLLCSETQMTTLKHLYSGQKEFNPRQKTARIQSESSLKGKHPWPGRGWPDPHSSHCHSTDGNHWRFDPFLRSHGSQDARQDSESSFCSSSCPSIFVPTVCHAVLSSEKSREQTKAHPYVENQAAFE